jgi:hypothetical protein
MKLDFFFDRFLKNPPILNFMKIHPVEAKLFHVDRWTDVMKLIVTFRNFVNAPKNDNEDIQTTRL